MAEGELIPESETAVDNGQEKNFDIQNKTIHLPDLEINFPYSEELTAGQNRGIRFLHLRNPGISEEIRANAKYLKGVKEKKAEEIINELERRGHTTNLLVRGLGGFYDENRPPTTGIMNFHEVQDIRKDKFNRIVDALGYVVESRLTNNAQVIDGHFPEEEKQKLLETPVAIMVVDQRRSTKIRDDRGYFDWEIKPDAVIAIFPFHINDPLVRGISK